MRFESNVSVVYDMDKGIICEFGNDALTSWSRMGVSNSYNLVIARGKPIYSKNSSDGQREGNGPGSS